MHEFAYLKRRWALSLIQGREIVQICTISLVEIVSLADVEGGDGADHYDSGGLDRRARQVVEAAAGGHLVGGGGRPDGGDRGRRVEATGDQLGGDGAALGH